MSEFLAMGGYGAYVWTAYGVTALALILLFVWSWFGARAREAELKQIQRLARAERRGPATATLSAGALGGGAADGQPTGAEAGQAPLSAIDSGGGTG